MIAGQIGTDTGQHVSILCLTQRERARKNQNHPENLHNRDEAAPCTLLANLHHLKLHEIALTEREKRQHRFMDTVKETFPELTERWGCRKTAL
ncbi:hypothetical protein [Nitrosomonas aestuarii]|uniref:hypothetical protein n=1 Tax=Nitrosomonas aestuarii TaxID=52441 RepID=UPI000D31DD35|nr:hypothetical protein [Nitrosomonas aestuarii]PTN12409.1 hypothetical protein C8R11_104194 [Nitrosomonas aestuarii]